MEPIPVKISHFDVARVNEVEARLFAQESYFQVCLIDQTLDIIVPSARYPKNMNVTHIWCVPADVNYLLRDVLWVCDPSMCIVCNVVGACHNDKSVWLQFPHRKFAAVLDFPRLRSGELVNGNPALLVMLQRALIVHPVDSIDADAASHAV